MEKKIRVEQLRVGMHISDINARWLDHPFLRSRFLIEDDETILVIRKHGIREVFIDTTKGIDADAPSREQVRAQETSRLEALANTTTRTNNSYTSRSFGKAREVFNQATLAVEAAMNEARLGRTPDISKLADIAKSVAHTVLTNRSAMSAVCSLQRRCEYTFGHSLRVAVLSVSTGKAIGITEQGCEDLALGGLLHDIGKMQVSEAVLKKPGPLSDEEMSHMREHVTLGELLLQRGSIPVTAIDVLLQHHERVDGKGYPHGLSGDEISLSGKIAAVADVYDAITSNRCYHKALPPPEAIRKIFEWSAHHFDKRVVECFVRAIGIFPVSSVVRLSDGRLAVVKDHHDSNLLRPVVQPVFDLRSNQRLLHADIHLSEQRGISISGGVDGGSWNIRGADFMDDQQ